VKQIWTIRKKVGEGPRLVWSKCFPRKLRNRERGKFDTFAAASVALENEVKERKNHLIHSSEINHIWIGFVLKYKECNQISKTSKIS